LLYVAYLDTVTIFLVVCWTRKNKTLQKKVKVKTNDRYVGVANKLYYSQESSPVPRKKTQIQTST